MIGALGSWDGDEQGLVQVLVRPAGARSTRMLVRAARSLQAGRPSALVPRLLAAWRSTPARPAVPDPMRTADVRHAVHKASDLPAFEVAVRYGLFCAQPGRGARCHLRARAHEITAAFDVYAGRNHLGVGGPRLVEHVMTASSPLRRGAVSALDVLGRLTERDRLICRTLWEHRILTTEQICDLCFTSLVSAQHRLVTLWRLGVLERFRSIRPVGSESWRYTLGPLGAGLVAAERGVDPPRASVLRDRVVALAAGQRTAHTLGVNGFFCALHAAARSRPDATLRAWWSERRCAAEWGDFVRPDAYGVWEEGGDRVEFFVEHGTGTGTETLARVAPSWTAIEISPKQRVRPARCCSGWPSQAVSRRSAGHSKGPPCWS